MRAVTEAATERVLLRKVSFKISQISRERTATLLKRSFITGVFL